MSKKKNVYLRSLEIGYEKGESGISLVELKKVLEREGYSIDDRIFRKWYFTNFEWHNVLEYSTKFINSAPTDEDEKAHRLFYNAVMQYLDYIELNQAMKSAKLASKQARVAIWIAALSFVTSVVFSVLDYFK